MSANYSFNKMTDADAREILSWRYEPPYDFYDPLDEDLERDVAVLVEPTNLYLSVRNAEGDLIGYYCFGSQAHVEGGDYSEDALDIGGSVRPDLTGTGMGKMFVRVALDFAGIFFHPKKFRATVATFNTRALRTCENAGFVWTQKFRRPDGVEFAVLEKTAANEG
jgi:RimJ/RimL family protein N-acetyltransferase